MIATLALAGFDATPSVRGLVEHTARVAIAHAYTRLMAGIRIDAALIRRLAALEAACP